MRVIITGALGHIGSLLIEELVSVKEVEELILIDDMSTQRYCSLFNLKSENSKIFFHEKSIMDDDISELFNGANVVIHLAAITNAAGSFDKQSEVESINFEGTKRIATICREQKINLLFLSTTSVYGTQGDLVDESCPESDLAPQSPYAISKLNSEKWLNEKENSDLNFVICRFGTIFGSSTGMRFHTAVNKFCWQASLGTPLTVWKTALEQKRPYLALEDGVEAIIFIIKKSIFDKEIYNVLTENYTVQDIVNTIDKHIEKEINVNLVDSEIMNQLSYNVSNQKFKDLGFEFKGSLSESISGTLKLLQGINR